MLSDNFDPALIYEVVWNGGPLLPPREQKVSPVWIITGATRRNRGFYRISDDEFGNPFKESDNER